MIQANIHRAKTQLSKLIECAEAGEEVIIARNGRPAVRLMPLAEAPGLQGRSVTERTHVFGGGAIVSGSGVRERRDIVGCMGADVLALSQEAWGRLGEEVAAEMSDTSKFDVELEDTLEFIPAAAP